MAWTEIKNRLRARAREHILDALDERGLIEATRLEFPRPGACVLRRFEMPGPGPGEVLIESLASVVSPGTERAVYCQMENVFERYPFVPGYSHLGRVIRSGPGSRLLPGQLVATSGPHASLHLCAEGRAVLVRAGIPYEHAALMMIGTIVLQGVRKGAPRPGERVLILGAGLLGQLAAQYCCLAGASVVMSARTEERLGVARECGIENTLCVGRDPEALVQVQADLVVDATGHPQAIHEAIRAAHRGGRIVLLGSSRGVTTDLTLDEWRSKDLTILGAHVHSLPSSDDSPGSWTWRREAECFLEWLTFGRLRLAPLLGKGVAPSDAAALYAALASPGDRTVGAWFDWSLPGPWRGRVERASPIRGLARTTLRLAGRRPQLMAPPAVTRRGGHVVRFGLIGCGEIAVENAAALRQAGNATITHAADPVLHLAESIAAATGAGASADHRFVLDAPDVDVVLINAPHHLHAPLAIEAAQAGKHVVVEKPMATSVDDCDRMIAAARQAGVLLSVCYCQRLDPRVQRAKELLARDAIGDIRATDIAFGQYRSPEYWSAGLSGRTTSDWRARRDTAGGGVLIMNACHILDYMLWLADDAVVEVSAQTSTLAQDVDVEDTATVLYRYRGGAMGTLRASTWLVGPGRYEQSIDGSEGQIQVAPELRLWARRPVSGRGPGRWHTFHDLPRPAERRLFFQALATAIADQKAPPVLATEARNVQAVIEAAYASASTGRTVAAIPWLG